MKDNRPLSKKDMAQMEKCLRDAAGQLPSPSGAVPVSPLMAQRRRRTQTHPVRARLSLLWHAPAWRTAILTLLVLCASVTTAMAASPELRHAIIHFFTSGAVEERPALEPPSGQENIDGISSGANSASLPTEAGNALPSGDADSPGTGIAGAGGSGSDASGSNSPDSGSSGSGGSGSGSSGAVAQQTVGRLTMTAETVIDEHVSAIYLMSPDYLELLYTASGRLIFRTLPDGGTPVYYTVRNGELLKVEPETHSLDAVLTPSRPLPGIMTFGGETELYSNRVLPAMEFSVSWQEYDGDILLDPDSGAPTIAVLDGANEIDCRIDCSAVPGSALIQVLLIVDGQTTDYTYPFLLDLSTAEIRDPLADVDLSNWPCLTQLSYTDSGHAAALGGTNHDSLRDISIEIAAGTVIMDRKTQALPPVDNTLYWFPTGEHTLFYTTGQVESMEGWLYDDRTGESTALFSGAAQGYVWDDGFSERYFATLGSGYGLYYEGDSIYLTDLSDGSRSLLEGLTPSHSQSFLLTPDASLLLASHHTEAAGGGSYTDRLAFVLPGNGEGWYFNRSAPPAGVQELSGSYSLQAPRDYAIAARADDDSAYYLYLYRFEP